MLILECVKKQKMIHYQTRRLLVYFNIVVLAYEEFLMRY